jgi:thiol-disulfide isomerase/thioredoxin
VKNRSRYFDYFIWAALGVAVVIVLRRHDSGPATGVAAAAIDLPLVGSDGRFQLAQHRGKTVVMEVFASWCGTCRRAAPAFAEAYRSLPVDQVKFVGISVDDSLAAAAGAKEQWQIPYDVAHDDGSVSRNYKVSLLPTVIVIGPDGTVKHASPGAPSAADLARWVAKP